MILGKEIKQLVNWRSKLAFPKFSGAEMFSYENRKDQIVSAFA